MSRTFLTVMMLGCAAIGCDRPAENTQGVDASTRAEALGSVGAPAPLTTPAPAQSTPDLEREDVRAQLEGVLGGFEDEPSAATLRAIVPSERDLVVALRDIYLDPGAEPVFRMRALGLMRHAGAEAEPTFEEILAAPSTPATYRRVATRAYAATAGARARSVLRGLLDDQDAYTRAAAVIELGKLEDVDALRAHAQTEPAEHVRWRIELALADTTPLADTMNHDDAREVIR